MKASSTISFSLALLVSFSSSAQNDSLRIDSLKKVLTNQREDTVKVNTLNELSTTFASNDAREEALEYARHAISLSKKVNFKNGEGNAYYNYAVALKGSNYKGERGSLLEVLDYLNKAMSVFTATGNEVKIADCYFQSSLAYFHMDQNIPESIKNMLSALRIYEKTNDKYHVARCYLLLGEDYGSDKPEDGLNRLKTALAIFREIKDSGQIAYTAHLIGDIYLENGRDKEALKYYDTCLAVYKAMGNQAPDFGVGWAVGAIGDVYLAQANDAIEAGDFGTALEKLRPALKIFKERLARETAGKMSHRQSYPELGDCYWYLSKITSGSEKKDNLLMSQSYYQQALQLGVKTNSKTLLSNSYYNLSEVSKALGNYQKAYEYYTNFIVYRDSLYNEENTKKTVQAEMQYKFDKEQALVKVEQEKKDAEAKRARNQQYFIMAALGIIMLAVVAIAFIQYRNSKHKQKANVLLLQQKEKVESTLQELKSTQAQLIQ